jgi:hypothetical protein
MEKGTMLDRIQREAMQRGLKLLAKPKVMRLMANPKLLSLIRHGFSLRSRVKSDIDGTLSRLASLLGLATRGEVEALQRRLTQIEDSVENSEQGIDE